jgi:hypothetical protein
MLKSFSLLPDDAQVEIMRRVRNPRDMSNLLVALSYPGNIKPFVSQTESFDLALRFINKGRSPGQSRLLSNVSILFCIPYGLDGRYRDILNFSTSSRVYCNRKMVRLNAKYSSHVEVLRYALETRSLHDVRTTWTLSEVGSGQLGSLCDAHRFLELGRHCGEWKHLEKSMNTLQSDDWFRADVELELKRQARLCFTGVPRTIISGSSLCGQMVSLMNELEITFTLDVFSRQQRSPGHEVPLVKKQWVGTIGVVFQFNHNHCRDCASDLRSMSRSLAPPLSDIWEARQQAATVFNAWGSGSKQSNRPHNPPAPLLLYDDAGCVKSGRGEDLYKAMAGEVDFQGAGDLCWELDVGMEVRLMNMQRPLIEVHSLRTWHHHPAEARGLYNLNTSTSSEGRLP